MCCSLRSGSLVQALSESEASVISGGPTKECLILVLHGYRLDLFHLRE